MDLFKNLLKDFYNPNFTKDNKSILSASFSYKNFKKLSIGSRIIPTLDFDVEIGTVEVNKNNLNALLYSYNFYIEKISEKEFKFIIQSKDNSTYLIDDPSQHYFANNKTALLNDARLLLSYPKKEEDNLDVKFESLPLDNGAVSHGTNLNLIDPKDINNDASKLDYDVKGFEEKDRARRLWSNDISKGGLEAVRTRTFTFNGDHSASMSVLGPVRPKDPNDFRFYVVTNTHVSVKWKKSKSSPYDSDIKKTLKADFRIPNIIDKPINYDEDGFKGPFGRELSFGKTFDLDFDLISNYRDEDEFWNRDNFKDGYNNPIESDNNSHLRSIFDMSILIVDLSVFFNHYAKDTNAYRNLNYNQKKIVDYIFKWKDYKLVQSSREARHANDYVNLNWFSGSFPIDIGKNRDGRLEHHNQRYREYIWSHSGLMLRTDHGDSKSLNSAFTFPLSVVDLAGGASGSSVFDSEGNLAALITAVDPTIGYMYNFNGNEWDFYGDGNKPFNQASFYEKMRLLSYLYPERYNQDDFKEKGFSFLD